MAVRIYSLAKELKLDSKVLVDICTTAGVTGKGSALASLSEEEVDRVKAFLAGGKSGPGAAAPAPKRPPVVKAAPVEPPPPPLQPQPQPPQTGALRREDYIAPAGAAPEKMPVLPVAGDARPKKKSPGGDAPKPAPVKPGPGIKLAPLPAASQPTPPPPPAEPAPQRPDLRLPADVMRNRQSGGKPLSEHLRKHEKRKENAPPDVAAKVEPAKGSPRDRGVSRGKTPPLAIPPAGGDRGPVKRGRGGSVPMVGGDGDPAVLVGREQRQAARKRTGGGPGRRLSTEGEEDAPVRSRSRSNYNKQRRSTGANTAAPRKGKVVLQLPANVRSFSEAVGVPAKRIQQQLMTMGTMATITAALELETIELLAIELGLEIEIKKEVSFAEQQMAAVTERVDDPAELEPRPPVITFLGHVDHGKTSLLDRIIGINVARGESGGITQHIRAYQIDKDGRKISFVDTPGHEAFTEMRARGANVTDIAVLVVAADDGVMPQTEEALNHARAAGAPIVVALNKIDLHGVDTQRIYQQLATNNLLPTEWGGDTEVVKTSATTGAGIDDLLETLLTIAELHDYRANPHRPATGACLEASLHEGRGVMAKVIVQNGTLRVGDAFVCGATYGRVKAMYDTLDAHVTYQEALPSMPVNLTGLHEAPAAGEHFFVLEDISVAREIAEQRAGKDRRDVLGGQSSHVTLENLHDHLGKQEAATLNIILRADVRGSIEAIQKELTKLEHPEVKVKILQAMVGGITEADVYLADASDAIIIGFNVVPDERARGLADQKGVQVRRYDIIYKVTDDLRSALEGMLKPEQRETDLGRALVQRTFTISRVGTIAGCRVLSGTIQRNSRIRVLRDSRVIGDYPLESLKREKDDAREVREGLECGMKLGGFNDLKEGDILEAYKIEEVARTF